jgi:hypothetical protein
LGREDRYQIYPKPPVYIVSGNLKMAVNYFHLFWVQVCCIKVYEEIQIKEAFDYPVELDHTICRLNRESGIE